MKMVAKLIIVLHGTSLINLLITKVQLQFSYKADLQ